MEQIDSGQIHLWLCFHESIRDPVLLNRYLGLLSAAELRQQRRFYFERDRHRYLVTRAMVRTVLSKYASVAPKEWQFATNPYGRPEVANEGAEARRIAFNISHTAGLIVLGVALGRAIGVDVENLHAQRPAVEIADRFFAVDEVAALRALPVEDQEHRFFEYWTLKESYVKARGMGLSIPLDGFAFDVEERGQIRFTIDPSLGDSAARWMFWQFEQESQYLMALCVARSHGNTYSLQLRRTLPLVDQSALDGRLLRTVATDEAGFCIHD